MIDGLEQCKMSKDDSAVHSLLFRPACIQETSWKPPCYTLCNIVTRSTYKGFTSYGA